MNKKLFFYFGWCAVEMDFDCTLYPLCPINEISNIHVYSEDECKSHYAIEYIYGFYSRILLNWFDFSGFSHI